MNGYEDIMNLRRPQYPDHPPMSIHDRAAQFSPFAALVGYDDAVAETARLTDRRREISEEELRELNEAVASLSECIATRPLVTVDYFIPDARKEGGRYESVTGTVRKIDEYAMILYLDDGTAVPIDNILEISGRIFAEP